MTTPPFPSLPPPPADPGEYLTHFTAHASDFKFTKDGALQITVTIDPVDKYLAMPLTDIRGRTFAWTVHAPRGRKPLVRAGTLGIYDAQSKVKEKREDRRWARVYARYFEGSDDED